LISAARCAKWLRQCGKPLTLFTDTGGGLFVTAAAARRLALPSSREGEMEVARLPPLRGGEGLNLEEPLPVFPEDDGGGMAEIDGMLGQAWFAGGTWTFDYFTGRLLRRAPGDLPAGTRVPLGFPTKAGVRQTDFPRITAEIDGKKIDLLFDTGATTLLSPKALAALADGNPPERATSFIIESTFARWHKAHPHWRVVERADANPSGHATQAMQAMIEVPRVVIAGRAVGPVWFTRRADKNFHQFMSQWMDKRVDGALGGNALSFFRVTVDYPSAVAVFESKP
jgi:hypothetical protein